MLIIATHDLYSTFEVAWNILSILLLIGPTSAKQGRFLKVGKSVRAAPILGLEVHRCLCIIDAGNVFISKHSHRLGRLWEERRASAGGVLSCRLIFQTSLIVAPPS